MTGKIRLVNGVSGGQVGTDHDTSVRRPLLEEAGKAIVATASGVSYCKWGEQMRVFLTPPWKFRYNQCRRDAHNVS
jgi:hypothetical protein